MADITQQSFAGGEVTEALASREDLAKQHIGVQTCRNFLVTRTGSARSRGGLLKKENVYDDTKEHRLIPFIPSRDDAYMVEFGDNTLRVYKDGAIVLRDLVDADFKWTLSGSGTSEYHLELTAGGDPGLLEPNYALENGALVGKEVAAGALSAGEWAYDDHDALGYLTIYVRLSDSTDPDSKAQGYVQTPFLITTPYSSAQNADIDYTQSADVMYLANKGFMPYELVRIAENDWTLGLMDIQDGPWLARAEGDEEITWTPSAKTGAGVTITASATMRNAPNVGDLIRIGYENPFDASIIEWSWATVTTASVPIGATIVVTVEKDLGYEYLLNPKFTNDIGLWEDHSNTVNSDISHDATTQALVLNKGATGDAETRQTVSVLKYERMTFEIVVDVVDTRIEIRIGNTGADEDLLPVQVITTPGTYSYTTTSDHPTGTTAVVRINTGSAPSPSTHKISRMSLMRRGLGTPHWRNSAWSAIKGYPSHVTLSDQSLYFAGGSIDLPDTVWKSKTGEYNSFPFNTPPFDTDAISFTLASSEVNAIQHITPFKELVVGTTGSEWKVDPGPSGDIITPTTIRAKPKSNTGSAPVRPVKIGSSLLFLNRNANKVYALTYSFDADGYEPADLTVLAPHLFEGHTITQWSAQEAPNSIVWCVRDDGVLLGLTYVEDQDLWAWHRHDTVGKIESVCVVPEGGEDVVYVITNRKRNVSGTKETQRYIERLMPNITDEDIYDYNCLDNSYTVDIENDIASEASISEIVYLTQSLEPGEIVYKEHVRVGYPIVGPVPIQEGDYVYLSGIVGPTELNGKTFRAVDLDSGGGNLRFKLKDKEGDDYIDGAQYADWVSGGEIRKGITSVYFADLEYLNGHTMAVMADGEYLEEIVGVFDEPATKWGFDLTNPAIVIHIGLLYTPELLTLPHDFITQDGTTQGKNKNITDVNIYFNKTRYAQVGYDENSFKEISFNTIGSGNNPAPLFTGIKEKAIDPKDNKLVRTLIQGGQGLPIEVSGVISNVEIGQG
jgi:hypothetical protein